ncbi:unnamed protein product [Anisakis simplex]|uniref:PEPCK_N domain-containing protein n=1 Tax=Anisakis simplex TaxID=6269 RepID=A0A0M3KEV0_ANISI|nr:unnamed protein product [Anisakis simplex]
MQNFHGSNIACSFEINRASEHTTSGRVMYVIPFSLGPIGSKNSLNCIQITDSEYVAIMTSICARVSSSVWDSMENGNFIGCVHSVGVPRPVNLNNATTNVS